MVSFTSKQRCSTIAYAVISEVLQVTDFCSLKVEYMKAREVLSRNTKIWNNFKIACILKVDGETLYY